MTYPNSNDTLINMKRAVTFLVVFLIGALIGALVNWLYFKHTMQKVAEIGLDGFASALYMYEVKEANEHFNNPNKDIALYVLNRAVINLELFQKPNYSSCRTKAATLAKYHIRLGELYGEKNDDKARNFHLNNAIKQYELMGWKFNNIEAIQNISTVNYFKDLEYAIHNNAERVPPCF